MKECVDFHKLCDCKLDVQKPFEVFGQSRSDMIGLGYTLKYNILWEKGIPGIILHNRRLLYNSF
jgi:hypothetical protein